MKFLRIEEVSDKVGLKRSAIYQLIKEGRFPRQVKLGRRSAVWVEAEIEAWIRELIEQRGDQ